MEKLMKPVEYAKELGISRQAVYAKIKRGILTAKNVDGKLYIVADTNENKETQKSKKESTVNPPLKTASPSTNESKDYLALLQAKDETISVLKGTVKDLKQSNKQISKTLRGEIDLLKEAFHEMRTLYTHQLEQKRPSEMIDVYTEEEDISSWVGLKKFMKHENITKEKQKNKVTKRLKKAYKDGDIRLMKIEGKLKINIEEDYKDLLK
ncbi:MAG: DUF3972 domain-containing protein [Sulfurovum sp.]|nr:DUF3972 domain-containing protein [Sulfurovum sp.]